MCNGCIDELNTSKANLRGAKYPIEKGGSLDRTAELQRWKVIINRNAHAVYCMRMRTHSCRRPHNCYVERSHGSHNCHTHESQAVAQLLHAEVTGVTPLSPTRVTGSRTTVTGRGHRGHTEGGK